MALKPFEFTLQFGAGIGQVDADKGILHGVTVAEVGDATGHFAYLDKGGKIIGVGSAGDAGGFPLAVRRMQLAMDARSLETVVEAGKAALRFKTREDHDDSIKARAGFSQAFRMDGSKVVCDVTLFDAYSNRSVFIETAQETPELIGLSGDFKFKAEIVGDRAMMRVTRIDAVDIVDKGALTHGGLFMVKAAPVDIGGSEETEFTAMAKTAEKPDLKAFKEMCKAVAAYRASAADDGAEIDECMAAILPPKTEAAPAANATATMTASEKADLTKELSASFAALLAPLTTQLAAIPATITTEVEKATKAQGLEFQKKMSALGLKFSAGAEPTAEEIAAAKKLADDAAAAELATKAKAGAGTDFLSVRASVAKEKGIKLSEASRLVMEEKPDLYTAHLRAKGVIKAA